jgi:hypothetical protein
LKVKENALKSKKFTKNTIDQNGQINAKQLKDNKLQTNIQQLNDQIGQMNEQINKIR